jgi:hypothetical protein
VYVYQRETRDSEYANTLYHFFLMCGLLCYINFVVVKIMYIIEIYIVPIKTTILIKTKSDLLTEFYNWTYK